MATEMMRAIRFHRFGSADELVMERVPRPAGPGDGEILVRVHASGINTFDVAMRAGLLQNRIPISLPATPGVELAGTVMEVGAGVGGFTPGQAVYANCISKFGHGSNAEFMVLPANNAANMPGNLNFDQAASLAHGARTAWAGLFEYGSLQAGQRLLVQGGAGGVGMYAIQLAKQRGAYVITTASADNLDFVRSLGADEVINYAETRFEAVVSQVDMVYDTVGGETMERSWQTLKTGGMLITAVGFPSDATAASMGVHSARVMGSADIPSILRQVADMVEENRLKTHIRKVFPMEQVGAAHRLCETRHGRGRIVLHIAD